MKSPPKWFKGDYEAYCQYMRELASRPHKRGGKSKIVKKINAKAKVLGIDPEEIVRRILEEDV